MYRILLVHVRILLALVASWGKVSKTDEVRRAHSRIGAAVLPFVLAILCSSLGQKGAGRLERNIFCFVQAKTKTKSQVDLDLLGRHKYGTKVH